MEIDDQMTKQTPIQIKHNTLSEKIASVQDMLNCAIEDRNRYTTSLDDLAADLTTGAIDKSKAGLHLKIRSRLLANAEQRVKTATTELRELRADLRKVEDRMRAAQILSMWTVPGATEEDCKIIEDW